MDLLRPQSSYSRQRSEVNESFLRSARDGNQQLVLEHLDYANVDVNTSNANGLTALHLASKSGHASIVSELLARGAAVDALTRKGNSSLHIAALAGQREVVETLVKNGARVNIQSPVGFTPLYMAAQENHAEVVKLLLDYGADQRLATQDGSTPMAAAVQQGHQTVITVLLDNDDQHRRNRLPALHVAAKRDDVRAAALLLQSEKPTVHRSAKALAAVNFATKSGFTALHMAAHYGSLNVAELLLRCGADVNNRAQNGITPMHVASKWGRSDIVDLLADYNADVECQTRDLLSPLHCAARNGQDATVNVLLARGVSLTSKTKNGLTGLHMAVQGDHVECARLILDAGADINDVTGDYLTALHIAAHCGNARVAELLLQYKCTVEPRALNGFTPLHIACKKNRIRIIELLMRYKANIECTTESGLTPLHVSAYVGHLSVVSYLLENGALTEARTVREETALHVAARARQTEVIRLLLRHGAQANAQAKDQQTALHVTSRLNDVESARVLLEHGATCDAATRDLYTPLHVAVKEGHDDMVNLLLDHGANIGLKTKKGFTALHIAAKYGHVTTTRLLIANKNCNVDVAGKNGLTPLHVATHYNNLDVVLVLLQSNASPHAVAKNGYTPLHIAAKMNRIDIAKVLLRYGAKADAESKNGYTPVHVAAQEGHSEMVSLLLGPAGNVDVRCRAKNGLTAMHLAAQEDHVPVAEVLVEYQAAIDPQTKAGYTPLHTACHFGQPKMVQFLLRHGTNVNSTTSAGHTALHVAAQQGQEDIVNLLLLNGASPDELTDDGQTALSIAMHLGLQPIVELLSRVTNATVATPAVDYMYNIVYPETMNELLMDSDEEGGDEIFTTTPRTGRRLMLSDDQQSEPGTSPESSLYRRGKTQEDLFAFEQSGRQSTISWSGSHGRDYITEEMRYMRNEGTTTPSAADPGEFRPWNDDRDSGFRESTLAPDSDGAMTPGLFTPGGEEVDMKFMMTMDSRPLADEGMTPVGTLERDQLHPLQAPVTSRTRPDVARLHSKLATRAVSEDLMDEVAEEMVVATRQQSTLSPFDSRRTWASSSVYSDTSNTSGLLSDHVVRSPVYSEFLVSFVVDARGGVMQGRRHSGLRLIFPPNSTSQPTRITCKLVNSEKLGSPPPLAEGEALATRVIDMGSSDAQFNSPVLLEIPHFASLKDKHREVCVLRSDNGLTWTEHKIPATEENVNKVIGSHFENYETAEKLFDAQIVRIICIDLPHYFAIVTRIRQESKTLGPAGGLLSSTVAPQAQAVFPPEAIIKSIRVNLQVLPASAEQVKKVLVEENLTSVGATASASPVVSIGQRPRKFHQPITVTVPLPPESSLRGVSASAARGRGGGSTLRLLCSMTGELEPSQWTDITGSSPLKLTDDCVSFTTTVSARFWLIDCYGVDDIPQLANRLFAELIQVPFEARCVVYARRPTATEAHVRLMCLTDDRGDKSLEKAQNYALVARSDIIQLVNGKTLHVDVPGMTPVVKKDERLQLTFNALRENRLHVTSRIRRRDVSARLVVMTTPDSTAAGSVCALDFALPPAEAENGDAFVGDAVVEETWKSLDRRDVMRAGRKEHVVAVSKAELRLTEIADMLHDDWKSLANELGFARERIEDIQAEFTYPSEQALVMLQDWTQTTGSATAGNELQCALGRIGRDDVIERCITNVELVTDESERDKALAFFEQELSIGMKDIVGDDGDSVKLKADYVIQEEQEPEPEPETEMQRTSEQYRDSETAEVCVESVEPARMLELEQPRRLSEEDNELFTESSRPEDVEEYAVKTERDRSYAETSFVVEISQSAVSGRDDGTVVVEEDFSAPQTVNEISEQDTLASTDERTADFDQRPKSPDENNDSDSGSEEKVQQRIVEPTSTKAKESVSSSQSSSSSSSEGVERTSASESIPLEANATFYDAELSSIARHQQQETFQDIVDDEVESEMRGTNVVEASPKDVDVDDDFQLEREIRADVDHDLETAAVVQAADVEMQAALQSELESNSAINEVTTTFYADVDISAVPASSFHTDAFQTDQDDMDTTDGGWVEETLPDGSIIRRRVITTTRHVTKRYATIDLDVAGGQDEGQTQSGTGGGEWVRLDGDGGENETRWERSGAAEDGGEVTTTEMEIGRDVVDTEWKMTSITRTVEHHTDYSENISYSVNKYTVNSSTPADDGAAAAAAEDESRADDVDEEGPKSPPPSVDEELENNSASGYFAQTTTTTTTTATTNSADHDDIEDDGSETIVVQKQVRRQQLVDDDGNVSFVVTSDVTMTSQSDDVMADEGVRDAVQRVVDRYVTESEQ